MAGALHDNPNTSKNDLADIFLCNCPSNKSLKAPAYGEEMYQYRQSKSGYKAGRKSLVSTFWGLRAKKL
jgi:hypothetical protein